MLAELKRYKDMSKPIPEDVYRPREMCKAQLRSAAVEALRRSKEEQHDGDDSNSNSLNYVLVAQRCRKIPERDFELSCLEGTGISKLWFVLTNDRDLLISKLASDITHGDAIAPVVASIDNFVAQMARCL